MLKSQADPKCRICKQNNETSHIVSACPKLAQKEYKRRHDNVARAIQWDLSGKCGFERNERWYDHVPESVLDIIDVAIPEDEREREKGDEKIEKYQDLAREVRRMWGVRSKVITVVVGALESVPLRLKDNL